jgi:hypothetical protein
MVSANRIAANRGNALKSTGPRTATGKAAASQNACKHGLFAREALAPGEDETAFEELAARLRQELAPEGAIEEALCARIAGCLWRLRRIVRLESGMFGGAEAGSKARPLERGWLSYDEADGLRLFSQYEGRLDRMLHRALHELQRLQAARRGDDVPLPIAVDVDVAMGGMAAPEPEPQGAATVEPVPISMAGAAADEEGRTRALAARLQPMVLQALSGRPPDRRGPGPPG